MHAQVHPFVDKECMLMSECDFFNAGSIHMCSCYVSCGLILLLSVCDLFADNIFAPWFLWQEHE